MLEEIKIWMLRGFVEFVFFQSRRFFGLWISEEDRQDSDGGKEVGL